ncbi:MAG: 50S ribosomal protein L10 [Candidatus Syntropharchaeales archaeon]
MTDGDVVPERVHHTGHIPQWKVDEVADIKRLIKEHNIFGLAKIRGISSSQIQKIRQETRGDLGIKVARNNLLRRALRDMGTDISMMEAYVEDQTAIIYSDLNPFKLYGLLEGMKVPAPIKGETISPLDITIEKGPTSFSPGPIVGELQKAGIPAAIEGGKVVIKTTKTVVNEGDLVSNELATMLARLEIYPLKVGLDLRAIYDDGLIFKPEMLHIDLDGTLRDLQRGYSDAFNLAVHAAYPTHDTIITLIQKAFKDGCTLCLEGAIPAPMIIADLIRRAQIDLIQIASLLVDTDALDDDLKAALSSVPTTTQAPGEEAEEVAEKEAAEAEEKEEEKTEEDAAVGLGSLFG